MGGLRARTSLLLAAAACGAALGACGDDPITGTTASEGASLPRGNGDDGGETQAPRTVDSPSKPAPAEVRAAVERTLGSWFRLVQYRAVQQALGLYTTELARRLRGTQFEDDLFTYFGPYVATKRLAIDEVRAAEGDPDRVTAFARLLPKDVPDGQPRPADELFLVALRRQGSAWRLADTTFVRNQADSIRRSLERQE